MRYIIACCLIIFAGCSSVFYQPANPGVDYRWEIERWQQRIQEESFNEPLVNNAPNSFSENTEYETNNLSLNNEPHNQLYP